MQPSGPGLTAALALVCNTVELKRRTGVLMRHRILVSAVALLMSATMSIAAGPAWGQSYAGGCGGYEGDHGRGCLPVTNDECEDGRWRPFDIFENLFNNQDLCVNFTEQRNTHYGSH